MGTTGKFTYLFAKMEDDYSLQRASVSRGDGYKLPIVLKEGEQQLPHQKQFCDFLKKVGEEVKKYCESNSYEVGRILTDKNLSKLLGCVYVKKGTTTPTLYAKVAHNPSTGQFYTNFLKAKVEEGESRHLQPKDVEGRRCTVNAVICPDSNFVSSTHVTLQVKVTQVLMEFTEPEVEQVVETLIQEW